MPTLVHSFKSYINRYLTTDDLERKKSFFQSMLFEALRLSHTTLALIKVDDATDVSFDCQDAKVIAKFLEEYPCFEEVNLSGHCIAGEGASALLTAFENSPTLTYIELSNNPVSATLLSAFATVSVERQTSASTQIPSADASYSGSPFWSTLQPSSPPDTSLESSPALATDPWLDDIIQKLRDQVANFRIGLIVDVPNMPLLGIAPEERVVLENKMVGIVAQKQRIATLVKINNHSPVTQKELAHLTKMQIFEKYKDYPHKKEIATATESANTTTSLKI